MNKLAELTNSTVFGVNLGNIKPVTREVLNNVASKAKARQKSAKKCSLCAIDEAFETILNVVLANAVIFQRFPKRLAWFKSTTIGLVCLLLSAHTYADMQVNSYVQSGLFDQLDEVSNTVSATNNENFTADTTLSLQVSGNYLPLPRVMVELAKTSGINLLIEDSVTQSVHIYWQDIPPRQALHFLCTNQSVWCEWQNNEQPATWHDASSLLVYKAAPNSKTSLQAPLPTNQYLADQVNNNIDDTHSSEQTISSTSPMLWESYLVSLNYADAQKIATLLNTATSPVTGLSSGLNKADTPQQTSTMSSLLGGGKAMVDTHSSQILLWLPNTHADSVLNLISRLDKPLPQVQIEARVLIASQDATRNLRRALQIQNNAGAAQNASFASTLSDTGLAIALGLVSSHILLSLELSALEVSGKIFTLAQPQVVVQSGQSGRIATGQEIPYMTEQEGGSTQQWKQAVLGLNVKPQVLAKNEVLLDVSVVQDSVGELLPNGALALNTHQLQTQVRMQMGQTLVLGGALYEQQLQKWLSNPVFGAIPLLSNFLKSQRKQTQRMELLVFVTPRLID